MNRTLVFTIAAVLALIGPACHRAPATQEKAPPPILVFAAASTTNALNEIKAQFTQETGIAVETSYASSSTLAEQIARGAAADLLLSADTKWADYLAEKGQVARRQDLLGNR